jgi:hypothetical protein
MTIRSPIRNPILATVKSALVHSEGASAYVFSPSLIASCRLLIDSYDIATWTQDDAGATPVTASGQTVGRLLSGTSHATPFTQATSGNRPTYTIAGAERFLSFDGTANSLSCSAFAWGSPRVTIVAAARIRSNVSQGALIEQSTSTTAIDNSFAIIAPSSAGGNLRFASRSRGTTTIVNEITHSAAAPLKTVATMFGRCVTGDFLSRMELSTGLNAQLTTSQGTASDYGNHAIYIGARAGSSLFCALDLFRIAVFTDNISGDELTLTQAWAGEV